jgi:hypothetical protein
MAPLFFFLAISAWAVSSPIGSSPDDNFHLASIWCGAGPSAGECEQSSVGSVPSVPRAAYNAPDCFAFDAFQSADCAVATTESSKLVPAPHSNVEGLYPPVFYFVQHLFVSEDTTLAVLSMRIANAALATILLSVLTLALPRKNRFIPAAALVITAVPLGMFIIPSTNPSSWAILSGATLLFSLVGYFTTTGWRKILLAILTVIATVIGVGARADSGVYSGIAIVVAVILTFQRKRHYLLSLLLPLVLAGCALAVVLTTGQVGSASQGLTGATPSELGTLQLIVQNVIRLPALWSGVFGTWGLGWLDTVVPTPAWVASGVSFIIAMSLGLRSMFARKLWALALIVGTLVVIPVYILVKSDALVGALVQPRYILPLIIMLAGVALYRRQRFTEAPWVGGVVIALLTLANSLSLHRNLRRYITGTDVTSWNLNENMEWWWQTPVGPMAVWLAGSIMFLIALLALYALLMRRPAPVTEHALTQPL